ncbi:MAG: hypothetical protein QY321_01060 [Patescibacteria group bacterium]|nr:MAG: hypothetical protein QY321_01060 [Patescibacteria group bacterium]
MTDLNQATIEKLQYYVYLLRDPRSKKIFYVGKGKGKRINSHELRALVAIQSTSEKEKIIKSIIASKKTPELLVLRHGLTEQEAFEIESAIIDFLSYDRKIDLTNLVKGHGSFDRGIMTLQDINLKYQAEPVKEFRHNAILITINRKFRECKTPKDLYNATRSSWRVKLSRASRTDIACAVYRGIIREVYQPREWVADLKRSPRIMFKGRIADNKIRNLYVNKSVKHLIKQGSSNPIKFISI